MATSQATPQSNPAEPGHETIEITKSVFDLDSKGDVTVRKNGDFEPISQMEDFVKRLNHDAALILRLSNEALKQYQKEQLESDPNVPWNLVEEDDDGNEVLTPFTGTLLSPAKSKSLQASVIQFAKLLFGYQKVMVPGNVEENRKAKKASKDQALAAILASPGAAERLKG